MLEIKKTLTQSPKQKPDQSNLGFGKYFSDHMVTVDYSDDKGWHNAQLVPTAPSVSTRRPWSSTMGRSCSKA